MAAFYTEKNIAFDEVSIELVYVFIKHCNVFKEQVFCFYPPYEIERVEFENGCRFELEIKSKENFVDLFEEEKVNVKIICGENGSGKTTLLKIMEGSLDFLQNQNDIIVVYKDKHGNFASTDKNTVVLFDGCEHRLDSNHHYTEKTLKSSCVTHNHLGIPKWDFSISIFSHYAEHKELYKGIVHGDLFTNFRIKVAPNYSAGQLYDLLDEKITKDMDKSHFSLMFSDKPFVLYLLYILLDNSNFQSELDAYPEHREEFDFFEYVKTVFSYIYVSNLYLDCENKMKTLVSTKYEIDDYGKVLNDIRGENNIDSLEKKIRTLLKDYISTKEDFDPPLNEFLFFDGYSVIDGKKRYLKNLSDGERMALRLRYEIAHPIEQHAYGLWWYIDEPEKDLHPEWSRRFIFDYMNAFKACKQNMMEYYEKYKDETGSELTFNPEKRFTLIFATHSPFLISDGTNDYVIYLKKDLETGLTKEDKTQRKEPFAGNIGEMFCENFFMENTIGEFARAKIKEIIEILNKGDYNDDSLLKYEKLVNSIGDELLRKLMLEKSIFIKERRLGSETDRFIRKAESKNERAAFYV